MPHWADVTTNMGVHGWIALALAVVGVAALHFALMWLARKPHDDRYDRVRKRDQFKPEYKPEPQAERRAGGRRGER